MCRHRQRDRWSRIWNAFIVAFLGSFAVLEGYALATDGEPATLSTHIRRTAHLIPDEGQRPDQARCRRRHAGRAVILAVLGWAALHLGWGLLGIQQFRGKRS